MQPVDLTGTQGLDRVWRLAHVGRTALDFDGAPVLEWARFTALRQAADTVRPGEE